MFAVLRNPTYAKLFSAQIIALLGTGLLTVALGLLAFDIAGGDAGVVMGVAMTIKMVAYVAVAPSIAALVARLSRKPVLIIADLVRAGVAVSLPFVSEAWQIYLLIFLLQSASATFTPAFQAVIPSVLPDEDEYTHALSLSRLAYDLESLVSPMLAAALLTVISYHNLFIGTVIGFLASAVLVVASRFPRIDAPPPSGFFDRLTRGVRAFWASGELRGLIGLNLVVATSTAMVIVNTVVLVQGDLGRSQPDVALLLGAYGGGSMIVALCIPKLLEHLSDLRVMLAGGIAPPILLLTAVGVMAWMDGTPQWIALFVLWVLLGAATSTILTPSARLLRRNSSEQARPVVFAAQFSLSHACFLITYPLAGALGAAIGLPAVALVLVGIGVIGAATALMTWRTIPARTSKTHSQTSA
ncbi:MFS transporter [Nesterenkonia alkaliphila]|uniref:MFS transporter n=1 Tax=Nesterenkonia alkaliphila TaxID=1463631 RepID=A0A7K1ULU2_9MICC|nr:MFS transporter [Nesterenkonia alkaliphila]MVT27439.1 MFS transporter [Nesterenkonia alkaliphila]GFZ89803.1 MFS transporter [Nesterenkonia alkaliphila]